MKTNSGNGLLALAALLSAAIVFASAYLCYASPGQAWPYALAISVICIAWIARQRVRGDRRKMTQAIVVASLLLAMPLLARLGWSAGFGPAFEARGNGFMMGALVVVFANVIPKQASSARGLALRRSAGWALVLGGAGYALAWLLLPLAYANQAALLMLLAALIYTAVRIAWSTLKHRPAPPGRSG